MRTGICYYDKREYIDYKRGSSGETKQQRLTSAKAENGVNGLYALQNYSYSSSTGNLSSKADVIYTYGDSNHTHAVMAMGSGSDSYISLLE